MGAGKGDFRFILLKELGFRLDQKYIYFNDGRVQPDFAHAQCWIQLHQSSNMSENTRNYVVSPVMAPVELAVTEVEPIDYFDRVHIRSVQRFLLKFGLTRYFDSIACRPEVRTVADLKNHFREYFDVRISAQSESTGSQEGDPFVDWQL